MEGRGSSRHVRDVTERLSSDLAIDLIDCRNSAPCGPARCWCALRAHADRFTFGSARVFSRFSAKRKNSRLVERYTSRSSKLEALWYSLLYSSARR
jgi:hypothetical protein